MKKPEEQLLKEASEVGTWSDLKGIKLKRKALKSFSKKFPSNADVHDYLDQISEILFEYKANKR